jgi:hypothetical protein
VPALDANGMLKALRCGLRLKPPLHAEEGVRKVV